MAKCAHGQIRGRDRLTILCDGIRKCCGNVIQRVVGPRRADRRACSNWITRRKGVATVTLTRSHQRHENDSNYPSDCSRCAVFLNSLVHDHFSEMSQMNPTRRIWHAMLARCYKPKTNGYKYYGGRGITVCERWRSSFDAFLQDMGERPPGMQIDRYPDQNGNYEPGNCRWATTHENAKNRRWTAARALAIKNAALILHNQQRSQTHCSYGHEYTDKNTYVNPQGRRCCRTCHNAASAKRTRDLRRRRGLKTRSITEKIRAAGRVNMRIAQAASAAKLRAMTHCKRGHEFTLDNILPTPNGGRRCKACTQQQNRERYLSRKRASQGNAA